MIDNEIFANGSVVRNDYSAKVFLRLIKAKLLHGKSKIKKNSGASKLFIFLNSVFTFSTKDYKRV